MIIIMVLDWTHYSMSLPIPNDHAKAMSAQLQQHIREAINTHDDWISFSDYMRMALYTPQLGYYSTGSVKLGINGDFTTSPEISPLFGMTLANTVGPVVQTSQGNILELGAGSGKLAVSLLAQLEKQNIFPKEYLILEISADLRERQKAYIAKKLPHLAHLFHWIDTLPTDFHGVILGNEVLDALPCHLIYHENGQLFERGVSLSHDQRFIFQDKPAAPYLRKATSFLHLPDNYLTEIQLEAQGLIKSLGNTLQKGIILLIDYGFEAHEYYHPERSTGTLMCHYQHHMHSDPFFYPGLQDITTHIDFTSLNQAAEQVGLSLVEYTTQAQYLIKAGLPKLLEEYSPESKDWYSISQAAQILTHPAEMGEIFKVITFGKNNE